MIFLDDRLLTHPKLLKAGQRLGQDGSGKALYLYLWGIAYAKQHLTDGFIPFNVISSCGVISESGSVAKVLADRSVRLWRKVYGGYQIHDFHKYNPSANEEKEKRESARQRMAKWRAAKAKARQATCNACNKPVRSRTKYQYQYQYRILQAPALHAGSRSLGKQNRRASPSPASSCAKPSTRRATSTMTSP